MRNIGILPFEAPLAYMMEAAEQKNAGPIDALLNKLYQLKGCIHSLLTLSNLASEHQNPLSTLLFNKIIIQIKYHFANIMYYVPIEHKTHQTKLTEFLIDQ